MKLNTLTMDIFEDAPQVHCNPNRFIKANNQTMMSLGVTRQVLEIKMTK